MMTEKDGGRRNRANSLGQGQRSGPWLASLRSACCRAIVCCFLALIAGYYVGIHFSSFSDPPTPTPPEPHDGPKQDDPKPSATPIVLPGDFVGILFSLSLDSSTPPPEPYNGPKQDVPKSSATPIILPGETAELPWWSWLPPVGIRPLGHRPYS